MQKTQISTISIPVRDQDKAKEFYVEKLGFIEELDSFFDKDLRWIVLRPPGGGPSIMLVTWFKSMKPGSIKGLVLGVANIEKTIDDLRRKGVYLDSDTLQAGPWGPWISLEDPDGNGWLIQQDLIMEEAEGI